MSSALGLPDPCLVVLVGPSGSGKTSWAQTWFPPGSVISSDDLRALVGSGPDDLTASTDAFALLDHVVAVRAGRRLTTVVDSLALDPARRAALRSVAHEHQMACVAVSFDTPAAVCRERNRQRAHPVPAQVLTAQLRAWSATRQVLRAEGFDQVITPEPVRVVPASFASTPAAATRQREHPTGLQFGLHVSRFTPPAGSGQTASWLRGVAAAAQDAGFDAIYVMDHFRQIPQVGRAWEDMLESYTTLAYLAACTDRVRLGALVTGITYRNVAHLGKIIATLDVLSQGRAVCGLGLGWFAAEHQAYGWAFPPVDSRYELLEDALELLPVLWGPGSPAYRGRVLDVPQAQCYPRPLQAHVPVLVGGGGERRTLRLAARLADGANVMGDLATVRRKAAVLRQHCADAGRDPREVALTHLSTVLVCPDDRRLADVVDASRPRGQEPAAYARAVNAGTVTDHVGRFRELAEAGVREVMVRVADLREPASLAPMAEVITSFR